MLVYIYMYLKHFCITFIMHKLVVCAVFKNESHILSEWIQHYLIRGIDHIYLINDNSTDNFLPIIEAFAGKVTLFHNDIVTGNLGRQDQLYEKYFRPILSQTEWMAILDLDEFLYSPTGHDIYSIVSHHSDASQIKVDWLMFGSSGHIYQPISVVAGFTERAAFTGTGDFYSFKCIFKAKDLLSFGLHISNVSGPTIHLAYSDGVPSPLVINHYIIQSRDFFMKVKAVRGDCDNYYDHMKLKRDQAYFDHHNNNQITDTRLFKQNNGRISFSSSLGTTDDVTLVITSCNRPALLDQTLESFVNMNRYPIAVTYLIDDSGVVGCNDAVVAKYTDKLNIRSIYNTKNIGQVESIDKVYSYVRTKWIFHCEEDWKFLKPRFIEKSMQVFAENPNEKIFTVWLRPHSSTSDHPIVKDNRNRGYYEMMRNFSYISRGIQYIWSGVTFNPGLRKTADCLLFHPYSLRLEKTVLRDKTFIDEYIVSSAYRNNGYYSMILADPEGHVDHIGWNHHIPRVWD